MTFDPNDPKLTAYVLGELDEAERQAVAAAVAESAELREAVEAIRQTTELLATQLQTEPEPELDAEQRASIQQAAASPFDRSRSSRRRWTFAMAAAATVLLAVGLGLFALPRFWPGMEQMAQYTPSPGQQESLPAADESPEGFSEMDASDPVYRSWTPMYTEEAGEEAGEEGSYEEYDYVASGTEIEYPDVDRPLAVWGRRIDDDAFDPAAGDGRPRDGLDVDHDRSVTVGMQAPDVFSAGGPDIPSATGPGSGSSSGWGEGQGSGPDSSRWEMLQEFQRRDVREPNAFLASPNTRIGPLSEIMPDEPSSSRPEPLSEELGLQESRLFPGGEGLPRMPREDRYSSESEPSAPGDTLGDSDDRPEPTRPAEVEPEPQTDPEPTDEPAEPESSSGEDDAKKGKDDNKPAKPTTSSPSTWRRARAVPNASRLMIGDTEELPLEAVQANVQIDGFRARVLLDYYFYNDRDRNYEGTFKLRLPTDASLYFFAFGETGFEYRPQDQQRKPIRDAFVNVSYSPQSNRPDEILKLRADSWKDPKVARVVPREKAAFAYRQTVRRRVDPALVEWSGAGVFSARVFPLGAKKLHRIVVGYDVDLTPTGDQLEYQINLPEVRDAAVDVSLATWAGGSAEVGPEVEPFSSNGRAFYHFDGDQAHQIRVRLANPGATMLVGSDQTTGDYLAASFTPDLPAGEAKAGSPRAVFLVDKSLSSNPDRFNVWLKLLRETLDANRDTIGQFAVLWFDVETHWNQERFEKNTRQAVDALIEYAHTLSLEGATDLGQAIREAARPRWFDESQRDEQAQPWDVFLLSDGALNWGQTNLHVLTDSLTGEGSLAGSLFTYRTGITGTDTRVLDHLARQSGGAVFSVVSEEQIAAAATAHRSRPWRLLDVELEGARDLLLAGRPKSVFPGQKLLLVGRGVPAEQAEIVLTLKRSGEKKVVRVRPSRVIQSELAPRAYGQTAVGQLETFGTITEPMSVAYARHFRVPGQTCSLLMLESEADYQRFDIKPEDDEFVVQSTPAETVIAKATDTAGQLLTDPKASFTAWLDRMEKLPGFEFRVSPAMRVAVDSLDAGAFAVATNPLECESRVWDGTPGELREKLSVGKVDYDAVLAESQRRMSKYGEADALRSFSSLVENSPGNLVLARDVAYSAMEWGLPDQAFHLLRRTAMARPYEPQAYLMMARALADMKQNDLALLYYEVALSGSWDGRFQDFQRITSVDYLDFLRQIDDGGRKAELIEFARARLERVRESIKLDDADLLVTILWNTDGTDVDLHVKEPTGEVCNYQHTRTRIGGSITKDCTQGFGPEMYTLPNARRGKYDIEVKYFSSDQNRAGTRTRIYATIHEGWGTPQHRVTRRAVALATGKEIHQIATVGVQQ